MMLKSLSQLFQRAGLPAGLILFYAIDGAVAAQAKPTWQREWEKTLEATKKEGQVTVYIAGYEAVLPDFEKVYPDIKLTVVTARFPAWTTAAERAPRRQISRGCRRLDGVKYVDRGKARVARHETDSRRRE
jgi:hypothetical protein